MVYGPVGVQKGETEVNRSRDHIWWNTDLELSKIDEEHQGTVKEALGTLSRQIKINAYSAT